ncbi:MAG: ribonuclease R [Gammaproteobacteria bacterium]|nr:ribonuclease R [Gammaproteobacteria bacterium]
MKQRRKGHSSKPSNASSPSDVLAVFRRADAPLRWPDVRDLMGASRGEEADALRRVLRGLVHSGELFFDRNGAYHLAAPGGDVVGEVQGDAEHGLVLCTAEERAPVRITRDLRVRAGDRVEARIVGGQAVVGRIVEYSQELVIGRLISERRGSYVLAEGRGFRGRVYLAPAGNLDAADGDTVGVRVVGEESYGLIARIVEVVVERDDLNAASTTLLRANRVPTVWPPAVAAEVTQLPGEVTGSPSKSRKDVRDIPLVTIDGEDARDFDDAVFCEARSRGGWRLVVAIADVAHYVKPGSALDIEARERGNSVYLPDRVVPMLPEELSNDLCSLRPDGPRLCMVCDMQLSASGRVTGFDFYAGVMHSKRRLTYTEVARFLDGEAAEIDGVIAKSLRAIHALYETLKTERDARGGLDFDGREQKLVLENGLLERIEPVERNDAHRLIEEAMILANVCAAKFLAKHERNFLYRVHEGPTVEKFEDLRSALAHAGLRIGKELPSPLDLKRVLDQVADRPDRSLLETLVLRSMQQAQYSPKNVGHFGLALKQYAHFTSPIRRYADLLVHRSIKSVLAGERGDDAAHLNEIGTHLSFTDRRAEEVSRAVADWLKCEYAARWVGDEFDGIIVAVTEFVSSSNCSRSSSRACCTSPIWVATTSSTTARR